MTDETEERILREYFNPDNIRRGLELEFERMNTEGPAIGLTPDEMFRFFLMMEAERGC